MDTNPKIRILSVDDHPLMREGIAAVINDEPDMSIIAQARSGKEAIEKHRQFQPDVTLLDLKLPDISGIDVLTKIRAEFPKARVIILTTFDGDIEITRALKAGASSFILKSMDTNDLTTVIRQVHQGKRPIHPEIAVSLAEHLGDESITKRETEILGLIAKGFRNREIAEKLFITEVTVKGHIKSIMGKLNAASRMEAAAIATRRGIINL